MAEPARKFQPEFNPHERPRLKVHHGGGEGDGKPSGNLKSAEDADSFKYTGKGSGLKASESEKFGSESSSDGADDDSSSSKGKFGRFYSRHKKKIIGGGIGGGAIGLSMFGFSIFHGPLQFIHISQMLQQFHFSSNDEAVSSRGVKLIRYMKNPNDRAGRRLTVLQNAIATRYETKLKANGIEFEYNKAGHLERVRIDPAKFDGGGRTPEQISQRMNDDFKIGSSVNGNMVDINHAEFDKMTNVASRKFSKFRNTYMAKTWPGKVASSMLGRPLKKKAGISLHPIKKLDRKVDEKLSDIWEKIKKKTKDYYEKGTTDIDGGKLEGGDKTDENGNTQDDAGNNAEAEKGESKADLETANKQVKSNLKKGAGIGVGVTGLVAAACAVKATLQAINDTALTNLIQPLMRVGADYLSLGSQAQAGHDIDLDSLGYYNDVLHDESKEPKDRDWNNARSIQGELGQELNGPDMPAELQPPDKQNRVLEFLNTIPGLGVTCKVVSNSVVQVFLVGAEIFSGAGWATTIAGEVVSEFAFPKLLDGVISTFGAKLVDVDKLTGAVLGNSFNYGARLFANEQAVTLGGRKLTPEETAQLNEVRDAEINQVAKERGFMYRTFSLSNPRSLMSFAYREVPASYSGMVSSITRTPDSLFSSLFSNLPFVRKANAQEKYEYSFPKYGYSLSELDNPKYANPIDNMTSMSDEELTNASNKYGAVCFGVTVSAPDFKVTTGQMVDPINRDPDLCDNASDETLNKFRFFIMDSYVAESMACYEGIDDSACKNVGVEGGESTGAVGANTGGIVGDIGENSDSVPCATGTTDLGVVETKYTGEIKKGPGPLIIRLCRLSSIGGEGNDASGNETPGGATVNSRVSGAWQSLGEKAKAEGIQLNANSSFRLADSCGGTGDGSACAKPGKSPHQTGIAIDFAATGGGGSMGGKGSSTSSCSGRARAPGDPGWVWLEKNAESFGFKQYSYEAWHWDAFPSANRCGTGQ